MGKWPSYPSAIDQWVMRHPSQTLAMPIEPSIIDVANPLILQQHLLCAAQEQPLTAADAALFGGSTAAGGQLYASAVASLYAATKLCRLAPSVWRVDALVDQPSADVNIRSIDQSRVQVLMAPTLHPPPSALRPTPYTLHPTSYSLHPASYILLYRSSGVASMHSGSTCSRQKRSIFSLTASTRIAAALSPSSSSTSCYSRPSISSEMPPAS